MAELKIVQGNDFVLRVEVTKKVIGGSSAELLPLDEVDNLKVSLVSIKETVLDTTISPSEEGVCYALVSGLSVGSYALQLTGKYKGHAIRSCERQVITIVNNNALSNVTPGEYEGEDSYNVDTTVVLFTGVATYTIDEVDSKIGDIGENCKNLVETTWSALKTLRDAGNLIAGQQYRITDYHCTTIQEDTQSADHQFDIIVVADSANTLNENARACLHSGDTYFSGNDANLGAWELKYSLDNDTDRYQWADSENGKGVVFFMKDEWNNECYYDFKNIMFKRFKIDTCSKSPDLEGLYGIDGGQGYTIDDSTTYWCYTFCMIDNYDGESHDLSVEQKKYISDEYVYYSTHDNKFSAHITNPYGEQTLDSYQLPNNVLVTDTDITCVKEDYSYGKFYGFYSNTFGNGCFYNTFGNGCFCNTFGNGCFYNTFGNNCNNNTFGNNCDNNTFGDDCNNNTFGNYCYSNTFGDDCYSNTFGNGCFSNTFGDDCNNNTFGNNCGNNIFGNYCFSNTFGDDCNNNTFGDDCYSNTFGDDCYSNTFGNGCFSNTFGDNCNNNTFGNNCGNNIFGNYCYSNTFGDDCNNNTFGDDCGNNIFGYYVRWCTAEDGVQNVATSCSTGSSAYLQNMHILNGTQGASSSNKLTISITAKRAYCTFVGKNSSGTLKIWCPADAV